MASGFFFGHGYTFEAGCDKFVNVCPQILGADFLTKFYLAPNHRDGSFIDFNTLDVIPATFDLGVK